MQGLGKKKGYKKTIIKWCLQYFLLIKDIGLKLLSRQLITNFYMLPTFSSHCLN